MSRAIKNTNNKSTTKPEVKKYCKVCHDAGKSETEYMSHFIRESSQPNSKVVCPTLLSLECRYCSKRGHTVKYCKILEKDKNMSSRRERANNYRIESDKNDVKCKQSNNIFDYLSDTEKEEEEQLEKNSDIRAPNSTQSDNFSEICSKSVPKSYASVLSTPVAKPVAIAVPIPVLTRMSSAINLEQENPNVPKSVANPFDKYQGKSWADTDSESDVEDFDYEYDPNW
jgi:hypothetical protein